LELLADPAAQQRIAQAQQELARGEGLSLDQVEQLMAKRRPFEGHWRARRGEYRVRYTIDDDTKQVHVLDIDHRRDAYHR
jgi:mRNA-degrading endonuclease RelE of RelBE toxin-antitoxin system